MTEYEKLTQLYSKAIEESYSKFLSNNLHFPIKKVTFDGEKLNVDYDNADPEKDKLIYNLIHQRQLRLELVVKSRMNERV